MSVVGPLEPQEPPVAPLPASGKMITYHWTPAQAEEYLLKKYGILPKPQKKPTMISVTLAKKK